MDNTIFVFGSNLAGHHGAGSAKHAHDHYGAEYGVGFGPTGNAYAIPTKDKDLNTLPLEKIKGYVSYFLYYAAANPDLKFTICAVGTGLAGYKHADIAPMFRGAPKNCQLPTEWKDLIK